MNLLNNPKTVSKEHVIRALEIRNIHNQEDINVMFIMTAVAILLFSGVFWMLFHRGLIVKKVSATLKKISVSLFIAYAIGIVSILYNNFHSFSPIKELSPHPWSLLRLFYLLDAIIVILGYILNISYELVNVLVFGVFQPLIILILCVTVFRIQSKRMKEEL